MRDTSSLRAGWDHTARASVPEPTAPSHPPVPLRAQILGLLSDPRVDAITVESVTATLGHPRQDIETTLDGMVRSGALILGTGTTRTFRAPPLDKQRLESMFRDAAVELGEHGVLARTGTDEMLAVMDDETEEPRLPVTAGLLSLFLPGTGQLLNGDVGRASLVFAVWSLAWITHLAPVWTFVCLYAGAEAFFTAKLRSMERKMAKEALTGTRPSTPRALAPPKPSST